MINIKMKSSGYLIEYNKAEFYYIETCNIQKEVYYEIFTKDDEQVEKWYDKKKHIIYDGTITSIVGNTIDLYAIIEVEKLELIVNLMKKINNKHSRIHRSDLNKRKDFNVILEDCAIPVTITPCLIF